MSLTDLDLTGTLSAATSAVGLVGAVLRAAPAIKNATTSRNPSIGGAAGAGPQNLYRQNTSPAAAGGAAAAALLRDPESERRAYETVNYVLREFGSRLCAAGLVDEHALTKALTAATKHIEVSLFSVEGNRLFESLGRKLGGEWTFQLTIWLEDSLAAGGSTKAGVYGALQYSQAVCE